MTTDPAGQVERKAGSGGRVNFVMFATLNTPDNIRTTEADVLARLRAETEGKRRPGAKPRVLKSVGAEVCHRRITEFYPVIKILTPSMVAFVDQLRKFFDDHPADCVLIAAGVEVLK